MQYILSPRDNPSSNERKKSYLIPNVNQQGHSVRRSAARLQFSENIAPAQVTTPAKHRNNFIHSVGYSQYLFSRKEGNAVKFTWSSFQLALCHIDFRPRPSGPSTPNFFFTPQVLTFPWPVKLQPWQTKLNPKLKQARRGCRVSSAGLKSVDLESLPSLRCKDIVKMRVLLVVLRFLLGVLFIFLVFLCLLVCLLPVLLVLLFLGVLLLLFVFLFLLVRLLLALLVLFLLGVLLLLLLLTLLVLFLLVRLLLALLVLFPLGVLLLVVLFSCMSASSCSFSFLYVFFFL